MASVRCVVLRAAASAAYRRKPDSRRKRRALSLLSAASGRLASWVVVCPRARVSLSACRSDRVRRLVLALTFVVMCDHSVSAAGY